MTLDAEDINGFKGTAAGKKAASKAKKRNKKNKNKEEDPALAWTAEYDPARPTDYVCIDFMALRVERSLLMRTMLGTRMNTRFIQKSFVLSDVSNYDENENVKGVLKKRIMSPVLVVSTRTQKRKAIKREGEELVMPIVGI